MAMVNIGGDPRDASYRYKRPKAISKVEGRGNGIKTCVVNLEDLALALQVPPAYPIKYLGTELGAQSKWTGQYGYLTGAFDQQQLEEVVEKFVKDFILCPNCHLPEIDLIVDKKNNIMCECCACSHHGVLEEANAHKLATFIVKNPPPPTQRQRMKAKKEKQQEDSGMGTADLDVTAAAVPEVNEADLTWSGDTDEASKKARREEMLAGFDNTTSVDELTIAQAVGDTGGGNADAALRKMSDFLRLNDDASDEKFMKEVKKISSLEGLDAAQRVVVMFHGKLNVPDLQAALSSSLPLVQQYVKGKKTQRKLLDCLEYWAIKDPEARLDKLPTLLAALYNADVLDEEVIVAWASKPSVIAAYPDAVALLERSRAAIKPFLKWLEEADEESDDDADDA